MWDKWKDLLHSRRTLLLVGLLGVALLLGGSFFGGSDSSEGGTEAISFETFRAREEDRLTLLCAQVRGVGNVRVAIEFEGGPSETYSSGHLTSSTCPTVRGVAVVCQGGNSDTVKKELTDLICALYGIAPNHVHISPMQ